MQIQNLFHPFEVEWMPEKDSCPVQPHKHTFFELVYITSGEGIYHINDNHFQYRSDNLFLMKPMDVNFCTVHQPSSFLFIRFNNIYLKTQKAVESHSFMGEWIKKLEYIFHSTSHGYGCIVRNAPDKPLVKAIAEAVILENRDKQVFQNEVMQQLVNTLIALVARNITLYSKNVTGVEHSSPSFDILQYIHQHIYQPDLLRAEAIASYFNISQTYVSEYFKKHTQQTLQQYIMTYKLSLVETRLKYSNLRVNEIANELNFSDESHLTNTFKKYKGVSPSQYRRSLQVTEAI